MGTELLPWVFTTGWASGINAYLVVLMLGIAQRFFEVSQVPAVLGRTDVMIVAAVLFVLEMFADKIPYLDSVWDSVHTVIRPMVGATLGYLIGTSSPRSRRRSAPPPAGLRRWRRTWSRPGPAPR